MARIKQYKRSMSILQCAVVAGWASLAEAETVNLYLMDGKISPRKIEVGQGDRIVIHNASRTKHSVRIAGPGRWFGRKHFIHELPIYPERSHILSVGEDTLKPASYNIVCGVHSRMRGTIVVRESGERPKALRQGEHRATQH